MMMMVPPEGGARGAVMLGDEMIDEASRKMAKTHQNVLVFCKGDPREAARKCAIPNAKFSGDEKRSFSDSAGTPG
jgi:hypothetical protein